MKGIEGGKKKQEEKKRNDNEESEKHVSVALYITLPTGHTVQCLSVCVRLSVLLSVCLSVGPKVRLSLSSQFLYL